MDLPAIEIKTPSFLLKVNILRISEVDEAIQRSDRGSHLAAQPTRSRERDTMTSLFKDFENQRGGYYAVIMFTRTNKSSYLPSNFIEYDNIRHELRGYYKRRTAFSNDRKRSIPICIPATILQLRTVHKYY